MWAPAHVAFLFQTDSLSTCHFPPLLRRRSLSFRFPPQDLEAQVIAGDSKLGVEQGKVSQAMSTLRDRNEEVRIVAAFRFRVSMQISWLVLVCLLLCLFVCLFYCFTAHAASA